MTWLCRFHFPSNHLQLFPHNHSATITITPKTHTTTKCWAHTVWIFHFYDTFIELWKRLLFRRVLHAFEFEKQITELMPTEQPTEPAKPNQHKNWDRKRASLTHIIAYTQTVETNEKKTLAKSKKRNISHWHFLSLF